MKKFNSDKFWEGVGALTVIGAVVAGAALLVDLIFNTNPQAGSDSGSDSFSDGVTDGILGFDRRSYDADYTAGYNVWSDD